MDGGAGSKAKLSKAGSNYAHLDSDDSLSSNDEGAFDIEYDAKGRVVKRSKKEKEEVIEKIAVEKEKTVVKLKKVKSEISRPSDQKKTLLALGLKKIGQVVEHNDTPNIMGMIKKVEHLVVVVK